MQLILLGIWSKPSTPKTRLTLAAAALSVAASLISIPLSHLEHKRSIRPSTILIVSLLFSGLFDAVRTRTLWSITGNTSIAVLFSITLGIKVALLSLEALGKRALLKPLHKDAPTETTAGIIGQSLFWWLNPLLRLGYKVLLTMDDLMTLDEVFVTTPHGKSGLYLTWEKGKASHSIP